MIYFFSIMTFLPLSVLFYLRILVKLHAIRRFLLSLVGRTLDRGFSAPELAHRFDWQERGCILSPTPDVICMLHFLFLTLTYFKTSQFMVCNVYQMQLNKGWIIISYIIFYKHVATSWTPAYVLYVWCFNGNINSSWYFWSFTRSYLTIELQM